MRWLVVGALFASAAWADIPSPDSSGCRGKTAGATCKRDDGSDATCVASTCSRNDYSNGPPPKSVQYECLECLPGPAPAQKKESCSAVPAQTIGLLALVLLRRRRVS